MPDAVAVAANESVSPDAASVLVASRDSRLARVTAFLLQQAGFVVTVCVRSERLPAAVAAHAPSVVVVDAASFGDPSAVLKQLSDLAPPVVVLAERLFDGAGTVRVLGRWPALEELIHEITQAASASGNASDVQR